MECFNCGQIGHFADHCPLLLPAPSLDEHLARIDAIVRRWEDGQISIEAKRQKISAENIMWYGEGAPALRTRGLTWPSTNCG